MSKEALRAKFEAWYEADAMPCEADWFKRDHDVPDEYDSAHTHAAWKAWQAALSLLRAELEAGGEAGDVFWVYELTKGEGVYQGVRGPNAESVLRQCVSGIDEAGEPFPLYASPVAADTQGAVTQQERTGE